MVLPELDYPDGPEMNNYKLQVQQFESESEQMQSALTVAHSVLEIGSKSPEDLLQEMVLQMESECNPSLTIDHGLEFLLHHKMYVF